MHPHFTRTVWILTACPGKIMRSRDAELSRIQNPVPILSHFGCNVTSHVDKVYTYKSNIEFIAIRCILSSSKCTKVLARASPWTLLMELTMLPRTLVDWGGDTPSPYPSTLMPSVSWSRRLEQCPDFCSSRVTFLM